MEKALEINMAANILWGIASIKAFISLMAYAFPGKVDLAYKTAREAVSIAEESGDIFSKTIAYSFCGCNGEKRTRGFAMEQAIARIILD